MKTLYWSHNNRNGLVETIEELIKDGNEIVNVVPLSYDRPILYSDLVSALIIYNSPKTPNIGVTGPR